MTDLALLIAKLEAASDKAMRIAGAHSAMSGNVERPSLKQHHALIAEVQEADAATFREAASALRALQPQQETSDAD